MNENIILIIFIFLSLLITIIISVASLFLVNKTPDKEKVSIYECGFNPFNIPGEPYSIRFFLIGILFLIFDLEIVLLFPWSVISNSLYTNSQLLVYLFIVVLIGGLIYEWYFGGLDWE